MRKETACKTSFLALVAAGAHTIGLHANAGTGLGETPIVACYRDSHLWAPYVPFDSTGN